MRWLWGRSRPNADRFNPEHSWVLRILHAVLTRLKLRIHPYSTVIGRSGKCFDFLGFQDSPMPIRLTPRTIQPFTVLFQQC